MIGVINMVFEDYGGGGGGAADEIGYDGNGGSGGDTKWYDKKIPIFFNAISYYAYSH